MSSTDASSTLALYQISPSDRDRVRRLGEALVPNLPTYIELFYDWLPSQPEFHQLFASEETVERVKALQLEYWTDFFRGTVDEVYLERRRAVGEVHARIGLSLPTYFAAMSLMLESFCDGHEIEKLAPEDRAATVRALTKQAHLDTARVVEAFTRLTTEKIMQQSRSLMAMSTPVTAIWRDVLLLPIVGVVDSKRCQDIMTAMLGKIAESQAKVIILDIAGVAVVDTAVANHLIKITKATKLMGCECTISGVSPAIAQTIVELGIKVGEVRTTATLRDALQAAFRDVGVAIAEAR
ncbi:MAG: protoglobin domain-containing protein [Myxococcota bacterium]|nr:protoglobin domain-containing protein [Myxococcota bacterium]